MPWLENYIIGAVDTIIHGVQPLRVIVNAPLVASDNLAFNLDFKIRINPDTPDLPVVISGNAIFAKIKKRRDSRFKRPSRTQRAKAIFNWRLANGGPIFSKFIMKQGMSTGKQARYIMKFAISNRDK